MLSRMILNVKDETWLKFFIKYGIFHIVKKNFDPYAYYEKTKLKKFKDSSKLEGIDINYSSQSISLEDILQKYRR